MAKTEYLVHGKLVKMPEEVGNPDRPLLSRPEFAKLVRTDPALRAWFELLQATPEDAIPSEDELAGMGLGGLLPFLVLKGRIDQFPGGAAASYAPDIAKQQITRLAEDGHRLFLYLSMTHGTDEALNWSIPPYTGNAQTPMGRTYHNELCCGGSGGVDLNIRESQAENKAALQEWAREAGLDLIILPVQAIADRHANTDIKYHIAGYTDDNFGFSEPEQILLRHITGSNPDPRRNFTDFLGLNKLVRQFAEAGFTVTGSACPDIKQGTLLGHSNINLQQIVSDLRTNFWQRLRYGTPRAELQATHHTEIPYALALVRDDETNETDPDLLKLALALTTQPAAMALRSFGQQFIAPSAPFVISMPRSILARNAGAELAKSIRNLFSAIDAHGYRDTRLFWQSPEHDIIEIRTPKGITLIYPDQDSHFFDDIRPGNGLINLYPPYGRSSGDYSLIEHLRGLGDDTGTWPVNPAPDILLFWPGSRRKVGLPVSQWEL